jgi:hypothetical protein
MAIKEREEKRYITYGYYHDVIEAVSSIIIEHFHILKRPHVEKTVLEYLDTVCFCSNIRDDLLAQGKIFHALVLRRTYSRDRRFDQGSDDFRHIKAKVMAALEDIIRTRYGSRLMSVDNIRRDINECISNHYLEPEALEQASIHADDIKTQLRRLLCQDL